MVQRGHEVEIEYSKKKIIDKINGYFGYTVVERLKLLSFNNFQTKLNKTDLKINNAANSKYKNKIIDIKNEKIKNSLLELNRFFSKK